MFTFSQLDRLMACSLSAFLPGWKEEAGEAAERGTAIHAYLEDLGEGMDEELALARVPAQWQADCARIVLDGLPLGHDYEREVAVSINLKTGEARVLQVKGRNYPNLGHGWLCGRIDVLSARHACVKDYKTGVGASSHMWQLAVAAMALASIYALDTVRVSIIRIAEDGPWKEESVVTYDKWRLDEMRGDLCAAYERWTSTPVTLPLALPGSHCHYCPGYASCPAKTALIRSLPTEIAALQGYNLEDHEIGKAYDWLCDASRAVAKLKNQCESIARVTGRQIPLSNGQVLGTYESKSTSWDGRTVFDVLESQPITALNNACLGAFAKEAVELEASAASIKRALEASGLVPRGKFAAAIREITDLVSAKNGITIKRSTRCGAHKPGSED